MKRQLLEFLLLDANVQTTKEERKKETVQQVSSFKFQKKKKKSSTFPERTFRTCTIFENKSVEEQRKSGRCSRRRALEYFLRSLYFLAGATGRKGPRKRRFKGEKGTKKERDWWKKNEEACFRESRVTSCSGEELKKK